LALTYVIEPRKGLALITRTHHPTFDEWRHFMEGVLGDPGFSPGIGIVDDQRLDPSVPSRNEVEVHAAWIRANSPRIGRIRWAVIVEPTALAAFGMARVGEFLTHQCGVTIRAFTDLDSGLAWAANSGR
jgi:hypothetical protein